VVRLGVRREVFASAAGPTTEMLSVTLIGGIIFSTAAVDTELLPAVATFIIILYRLLPRAQSLIATRVQLLSELGAIDNVMDWLDPSNKPYIVSGTIPFDGLHSGIELIDLSFHYRPGDRAALNNVSLTIRQGETVAIVGPSGSGKSTLINLLCRFYDPDSGDIIIDGIKLPQLVLADWRKRCAIVSQNVHLFDGTISENIAYGRLDATEDEVIDAAERANAHSFISERPQQYATRVGDNGLRLSGGQRQRIALARAIIRDPELLVLDEATNALDSISEDVVQEALNLFGNDRTVLIIAHRLSTVRRANRIFVLDQGKLVETGDFATLQQRSPLFARLCGS
jgi:subfamily B ATP-binding cassette protein MsbA